MVGHKLMTSEKVRVIVMVAVGSAASEDVCVSVAVSVEVTTIKSQVDFVQLLNGQWTASVCVCLTTTDDNAKYGRVIS